MPRPLDIDMSLPLEKIESDIKEYIRTSKLPILEFAKERLGKQIISKKILLSMKDSEYTQRLDKEVHLSHFPNTENQTHFKAVLNLLSKYPEITTFTIDEENEELSLSAKEITSILLSYLPKHITKVLILSDESILPFCLPTSVNTLIRETLQYDKEGMEVLCFPGITCLNLRFNTDERFSKEELEQLCSPSLIELRMEPIRPRVFSTSDRFWETLSKASNLSVLHLGQWLFSSPLDISFVPLLKRAQQLPPKLKKLSFYWDDIRNYSLENLQKLAEVLATKGIDNIEIIHSGMGLSRELAKMDNMTGLPLYKIVDLDPNELSSEENRIKLQAVNRWEAREHLLKNTLRQVPMDVTEIISQYLQIIWFAPPSIPVIPADEELNVSTNKVNNQLK